MARGGRRPRGAVSKSHKRSKKMSLDKRIEKILAKNTELKYVDHAISNTPPAAGVNLGSFTTVADGTLNNQRIGTTIQLKKILLRVNLLMSSTTDSALTADAVRIMVILNHTDADTLRDPSIVLSTPALINDFNDLLYKGAFSTLMDKYITMECPSGSYNGTTNVFGESLKKLEWYKDMDLKVTYTGTAGTIGQMGHVSLQVLAWSTVARITITGTLRIRYTDS